MRTTRAGIAAITLACCLLGSGCVTWWRGPDPEAMVTPLGKLTPAVQALVRWPDPRAPVADDRLVAEVFREKPELREAFAGVPVRVWHDARDVVVLVCSPDGKRAWLEDASWTPFVDVLWFRQRPPQPAEFTLRPPAER